MSVSLLTVWRAARARAVPFTGESAAYLVLLACEEQTFAPRSVDLSNIGLDEAGGVQLRGREPSDDARAERELRQLLAQLLEVTSSPGIALVRAASRPCCGSLAAFGAELTKALIPFNRAAARRALNRLYRETERAEARGLLAPAAVPTSSTDPTSPPVPRPAGAFRASGAQDESGPGPLSVPSATTTPQPLPLAVPEPSPVADQSAPSAAVAQQEPVEPFPVFQLSLEPSPVSPFAVLATPPAQSTFASPSPPSVLPGLPIREAVSSAKPPPVIERLPPAHEPAVHGPQEPSHLPDPCAASAPCGDWPTRPETLVARRRAGGAREREWTEPLPTPRRMPPRAVEVASVTELERPPETPPLGSLVYSAVGTREPLAFEVASDDPTERSPAVCELELASSDGLEWPVELADRSAAIPLEPERDALPPIPEPESYPGMTGEKSDVRSLLSGFQVEGVLAENDLRGELKRFLGIDETPRPSTLRRR
jgi:hypothetical protein